MYALLRNSEGSSAVVTPIPNSCGNLHTTHLLLQVLGLVHTQPEAPSHCTPWLHR